MSVVTSGPGAAGAVVVVAGAVVVGGVVASWGVSVVGVVVGGSGCSSTCGVGVGPYWALDAWLLSDRPLTARPTPVVLSRKPRASIERIAARVRMMEKDLLVVGRGPATRARTRCLSRVQLQRRRDGAIGPEALDHRPELVVSVVLMRHRNPYTHDAGDS